MARLTIYHRSPIIYRYVIRGVPGDESTNVGQYLVVRFVRATDKDTGKDCMILRSGVECKGCHDVMTTLKIVPTHLRWRHWRG